jgi:urease accessory protein
MPAPRTGMRMRSMATPAMITRTPMMMIMVMIIITIMATTIMIMATITTMTIMVATDITAIPMLMAANDPSPVNACDGMTEAELAALYRLMTWLSPAFPVGGFSYSSGIEWAVEAGDITDAVSLKDWLAAMLTDGSGFCDAAFLSQAHRAVEADDVRALQETTELAAAFVPSRERQLETSSQGRAFIEIARAAWNCDRLDRALVSCAGPIVYPVAVGLVSAAHAIPRAPALHAFLHALVSNWISAGSRLIPLGQTDSQRVLAALERDVAATARRAMSAAPDDVGSATFRADLASLRHETQYTRLFRS